MRELCNGEKSRQDVCLLGEFVEVLALERLSGGLVREESLCAPCGESSLVIMRSLCGERFVHVPAKRVVVEVCL